MPPRERPPWTLERILHDLESLVHDIDSAQRPCRTILVDRWIGRLNACYAHLRSHLGDEAVPDDFALDEWESTVSGRYIREDAIERLRNNTGLAFNPLTFARKQAAQRALSGLGFERLHPDVQAACGPLFLSGHYQASALEACKATAEALRVTSGLEVDGTALAEAALGGSSPPVRLNAGVSSTDRSEQQGFMRLASGLMLGVRNRSAHEVGELDRIVTFEWLCVASLILRYVEERL